MVSNFRYYSFKLLEFNGRVPFVMLVAVMLGFALVVLDPPILLFLLFIIYALSGPVLTLVQRRRRRVRRRKDGASTQQPG
jgi:CDP-diacylglycerol--serine O-phosphatidyltransferase